MRDCCNHCIMQIFIDLQKKNYLVSAGDVYGGDYCLYCGDASHSHSVATVRILGTNGKVFHRNKLNCVFILSSDFFLWLLWFVRYLQESSWPSPVCRTRLSVLYISNMVGIFDLFLSVALSTGCQSCRFWTRGSRYIRPNLPHR